MTEQQINAAIVTAEAAFFAAITNNSPQMAIIWFDIIEKIDKRYNDPEMISAVAEKRKLEKMRQLKSELEKLEAIQSTAQSTPITK